MILVGDAETYYDRKTFSISKMGTEEYILDKQFQVHGWALSANGSKSEWLSHQDAKDYFSRLNWNKVVFVAHNCMFDAAILVWRYGHMPGGFIDTMGLANEFIRPFTGRSSLDECAKYLHLPLKSDALNEVNGKRTDEIKKYQGLWDKLGGYACQDNDNCRAILQRYYRRMSTVERIRMDWAVRNYVRGRLRLDVAKLHEAYNSMVGERDRLLADAGISQDIARSRAKFAKHLESLGVEVEYKNGKNDMDIPAIAKNDRFVQQLLLDGSMAAKAAMKARLAAASTIGVSRAERLLRMARATKGKMLLPTIHHAAHTGRPGGTDGVNPLNFRKSTKTHRELLREAIIPQKGYVLVDVDASQVEARLCAWMAGCYRLLSAFEDPSRDPYCEYGTDVLYRREITKADELEREICKVEVLSLQYQVGKITLCKRLQARGIEIDLDTAEEHVDAYRSGYPEILANGREFQGLLMECVRHDASVVHKGCELTPIGILLPSGRWIYYDKLSINGKQLAYYSRRYKSWQTLFPGAINENLCQAMANDIVGEVQANYVTNCVNMLYDSVVFVERAEDAEAKAIQVAKAMSVPPAWTLDVSDDALPLRAEYKIKEHW